MDPINSNPVAASTSNTLTDNTATTVSGQAEASARNLSFIYHSVRYALPRDNKIPVEHCKGDHIPRSVLQCEQAHLLCGTCCATTHPSDPQYSGTCPEHETECRVDQYQTRLLNNQVVTTCPTKTTFEDGTGCEWTGNYSQVEDHLDECEHIPLSMRIQMMKSMSAKLNEIPKPVVAPECPSTSGASFQEQRPNQVNGINPLQERVVQLEDRLANGLELSSVKEQQMQQRLADLSSRVENNELKLRNTPFSGRPHCNHSDNVNISTERLDRLEARFDQLDQSTAMTSVKIADMEQDINRIRQRAEQIQIPGLGGFVHSGTLVWKIDNYQRKRQDAINGVKTAIYSEPFYSASHGYKMCMKVYLNGDGFGKNSHISLFFVVMKGDYDALLPWPFQKKITMMMLDQGNGDHMIDAFNSDPQSSSFKRPTTNMNIASGSPLFMRLDSLDNRQYIKDDTMFLKVIVD